jgi:hypothetical protein
MTDEEKDKVNNEKIRLLKEIAEELKKLNETNGKLLTNSKEILDFFYSIDELNRGEETDLESELRRDGFKPPMG